MKSIVQIFGMLILGVIGGFFSRFIPFEYHESSGEIMYVDLPELTKKSTLHKRMQEKISRDYNSTVIRIDSARQVLDRIKQKLIINSESKALKIAYDSGLRDLNVFIEREENRHREFGKELNEKYWSKVNHIIEEYGDSKGLTMVIGATGDGGVMYGRNSNDITKDIIKALDK